MIPLIVRNLGTKLKRKKLPFIIFSVLLFLYVDGNLYLIPYEVKSAGRCTSTVGEMLTLKYIAISTHEILNKLKIHHFLCYGSLWGAMRYSDPLPWDYDFDVGVLYEDIINVDKERLYDEFRKKGIQIHYQAYAGNYKVVKGNITGDIMIFRDYYNDGILRRIGFESWLLFINYRYYHQFPRSLVVPPLPKMKFMGFEWSVPRGGIEIQKYLYPKNWWKEVKPYGCR